MRRPAAVGALLVMPVLLAGCGAGSPPGTAAPSPSLSALDPTVARDTLSAELDAMVAFLAPLNFDPAADSTQEDCDTPAGPGRHWLMPEYVAGAVQDAAALADSAQQHWEAGGHPVVRDDAPDFYSVQVALDGGSLVLDVGVEGQGATLSGATECQPMPQPRTPQPSGSSGAPS